MSDTGSILLVDDDSSNIARLVQILEPLGLRIEAAGNGAEALDTLSRNADTHGFNGIVITDLKMPVMDGMAFMHRATAADADLPVIMISAYGDAETVGTALARGADKFLTKPVNFVQLKQDVLAAMGGAGTAP